MAELALSLSRRRSLQSECLLPRHLGRTAVLVLASPAIEAVFAAITSTLKSGDDVRLIGFGSFSVSARAARDGRNLRTGETISIAASKAPKFSAGKAVKDAVNG